MKAINRFTKKPNGKHQLTLEDGDKVILFQTTTNYGLWNYCIQQPNGEVIFGDEEQVSAEALAEVLQSIWMDLED